MTIIKFKCLDCNHRHDIGFRDNEEIVKPKCPTHKKDMVMMHVTCGSLNRLKDFFIPEAARQDPEIH